MFFLHSTGYLFFISTGIFATECGKSWRGSFICNVGFMWALATILCLYAGFMASGFWIC